MRFETSPRTGWLLALFALSSLITALDFTIVYVALPDIARGLGFSAHGLQWVISGYAITYGGLLLLAGRLSDLVGRRRVLLTGMALFAVGSTLGGLAGAPGLLIAARAIQGMGAAALFSSTLALVSTTFPEGRRRDRALGVWAAAGALGLSGGALLGGVLTDSVGWEGVFFVTVPLAVLGAAGAVVLLRPDPPADPGAGFDLPGALTGTAGATLVVFVIAQGSDLGWGSTAVVGAALGAAVLLAAFVAVERAAERPLLPLRLLRNVNLSAALMLIVVFGMTFNVVPYALTQYFQGVLGFSALEAGLGFLVPTVTITSGSLLGERLVARIGARGALLVGVTTAAIGTLVLTFGMGPGSSYAEILPGAIPFGLGVGVVFPAMFVAASTGVAEQDSGIASGLVSTGLQIGSAAGLAVLVGVATADFDTSPVTATAVADGLRTGLYVVAAGSVLAIPAALALDRRKLPAQQLPPS